MQQRPIIYEITKPNVRSNDSCYTGSGKGNTCQAGSNQDNACYTGKSSIGGKCTTGK